jgi:N6-L-threonylcarbamoyladenine synthase
VIVLGIESSCDETAAAVVTSSGHVKSDVVQSQVALHATYGGVVPELASRDHLRNASAVVEQALARAGIGIDDVDGIAVTNRPGLVGALLVGVQVAKGLAWGSARPLVGVDHLMGHLLAVYLQRGDVVAAVPEFPFVCLLASGGHTALYRVDAPRADAITELGATRDDAAGECFDKVGKLLGLGYPGGPIIDRLAKRGDPTRYPLKAPMARSGTPEFSFSGIKTQVAQIVAKGEGPTSEQEMADFCASFQAAVTGVLAEKLLAVAESEGVPRVVIGGGVAANGELRRRVQEGAAARGFEAFVPAISSCTDNAAMIAYAGAVRLAEGQRDDLSLVATSATVLPRRTRKGRGDR